MSYDAELSFFLSLLNHFHLNPHLLTRATTDLSPVDHGFRKLLGMEQEYQKLHAYFRENSHSNIIYKVRDSFLCHYVFLLLPDSDPAVLLSFGPYTTTQITRQYLMMIAEKNSLSPQLVTLLEKYFNLVPYIENERALNISLNTFAETIWNDADCFSMEYVNDTFSIPISSMLSHPQTIEPAITSDYAKALEQRYDIENQYLKAVSQGLSHKAELIIEDFSALNFEQRNMDPLRNLQNYCIIMNTLLRKAAEEGSVHPLYIDRVSSDFAKKIEALTSLEGGARLQHEMTRKYCLLVRNHSMKGYSLLTQKAIIKIDSDLTAHLSLNALAEFLNVNASYLSRLFKNDTGITLTEYVNHKRIEHGIFLLNTTMLQIQTIAQHCGIPDINYFTKLFKKQVHMTPTEYRENIQKGISVF